MAATCEPKDAHSRSNTGGDAGSGILNDDAVARRESKLRRRMQKDIRSRLPTRINIEDAIDVGRKEVVQPCTTKLEVDAFRRTA